ncbi:MAG: ankyrin repeat domain-containing protein [Paludibacter sp.]
MPIEEQKYQGIKHLLVGPTVEEFLEYYRKKIEDGESSILIFYEKCKENDISGGPSIEEVNKDLRKKVDIGEFDIFKYIIFCKKYGFDLPTKLEVESNLNNLFKLGKFDILFYFKICRAKNLSGGPSEEDIIHHFLGKPDKLLLFACKESSTRCAEYALNVGAKAKAKHNALISASKKGNREIVQLLITHDTNIHSKKEEALREAAYHGQLDVIKLLVANDADIHINNEEAFAFAVSCHTNNGHLEVLKFLHENDANIELSRKKHSRDWNNIRDKKIKEYLNNILPTTKN